MIAEPERKRRLAVGIVMGVSICSSSAAALVSCQGVSVAWIEYIRRNRAVLRPVALNRAMLSSGIVLYMVMWAADNTC